MRICASATILVFLTLLSGCGDEANVAPRPAPCLPRAATSAAPIPTADLSALDPARCPALPSEDLRGADPRAPLLENSSIIATKAFYLLTLFETRWASVGKVVCASGICAERRAALTTAGDSCGNDLNCWAQALTWSDADIERVGDALAGAYDRDGDSSPVGLIAAELRTSGHAQRFASLANRELLTEAWGFAARALNQAWADHVAGLPWAAVAPLLDEAATSARSASLFAPLVDVVLGALEADGRDEATRYEPLVDGANAAALAQLHCIDFGQYPFAVILVPGQGPNDLDHPLDPTGQSRADQAATRFAAGLAPLIALSGGHVHPDRTPYSEAMEMKRYLMEVYGIPEWAILVDPHARHTTTNLRNVGRLLYRYGLPVDQPSLITSDQFQIAYIAFAGPTQLFGKRNLDELGYLPYRAVGKLDLLDDCWFPSAESLSSDARDLLDP